VPILFRFPHRRRRVAGADSLEIRRSGTVAGKAALSICLLAAILCARNLYSQNQGQCDPTEAPVTEKSNKPVSFTSADLLRFYRETTFSPFAFTGPVLGATFIQWTTRNPPEWSQGFAGFGRRLLSGYSRQLIANSVAFGVAWTDHEDPRHYRTGQHGIRRRSLYAAREAVLSRNAETGKLMPAYSRIVGDYAAGFVSNAWYPAQFSNVHDALWRGSTALASDIVWQEFKEFWPDVRRKLSFHH
jgi:hypothetical protein